MSRITPLKTVNSVDYVHQVFSHYRSGDMIALNVPREDLESLDEILSPFDAQSLLIPNAGGGWIEEHLPVIDEDVPAQVMFTSGTGGRPKVILHHHKSFADVVERLNTMMQVDDSIREYVGVPVCHAFGLGRCRAVATAGGRSYIPENGFDLIECRRMLARGEINAISMVPTLCRVLLARPELFGQVGENVRWIEIGTQFMHVDEKKLLKEIFPNARIVQQFGLTEAPRSSLLAVDQVPEEYLSSVGTPYGNAKTAISVEGHILVSGPHVAAGILNGGVITPLTNEYGWLDTHDQGRVVDGYLYFEGRSDDLINCGGINIDPEQLQQRAALILNAPSNIAICGCTDPLWGQGILAAVEQGTNISTQDVTAAVQSALKSMGIGSISAILVRYVGEIPRTASGKIRRRQLASQYEGNHT